MIQMIITKEELQKALSDLEKLSERGFVASTAIFKVYEVGNKISDTKAKYSGNLIIRANNFDNWGSISSDMIDWYRYDGKLIEDY